MSHRALLTLLAVCAACAGTSKESTQADSSPAGRRVETGPAPAAQSAVGGLVLTVDEARLDGTLVVELAEQSAAGANRLSVNVAQSLSAGLAYRALAEAMQVQVQAGDQKPAYPTPKLSIVN